jgi:tagatose 1,6-diphosphate aldolase
MEFFNTNDLRDNEIYLALIATHEAIPEKKWVASYSFNICLLDGTKIGFCNFRIDNSELTKYCGNIGYGIDEKYRGHRYSASASKLLLPLAKKHGLKYVLINCEPDNAASNKICQLLNAKFTETVDIPETHEMYQEGKRQMNIYKIKL